jgi:hypothetical protein
LAANFVIEQVFEYTRYMIPGGTAAEAPIGVLRDTATALRAGDVRDSLRAVQRAQDVLNAVKADLLVQVDSQRLFELDGASTAKSWVRTALRLDGSQAAKLVRCGDTLRRLPAVAAAAEAGQIRLEHVNVFTYGRRHEETPRRGLSR